MSLSSIVTGLKTVLAAADASIPVRDPADSIAPYPVVVIYPWVGNSNAGQHAGRDGRVVYDNRDLIVIETHWDEATLDRFNEAAIPMIDRVRDLIWQALRDRSMGFAAVRLHTIRLEDYGALGWGSDKTYGFRMLLEVTHSYQTT